MTRQRKAESTQKEATIISKGKSQHRIKENRSMWREWWMATKLKVWQKCDYVSVQQRAHCSLSPSCFPPLTLSEVPSKQVRWPLMDRWTLIFPGSCLWTDCSLCEAVARVTVVVQESVLSLAAPASLLAHPSHQSLFSPFSCNIFQLHNILRLASHWSATLSVSLIWPDHTSVSC